MQTIEETYRLRLLLLAKELGSQRRLADKLQRSPSQVNQWIKGAKDSKTGKPRSLDKSTARYIEQMTGKPDGWCFRPQLLDNLYRLTLRTPTQTSHPRGGFFALTEVTGSCIYV